MEEEVWKDVPGYEGYYVVSNLLRVKSLPRLVKNGTGGKFYTKEKIMNRHVDTTGYYTVALSKNNIMKKIKLHRIIAMAFIPNPNNYPEINHIDFNRKNPNISNLEWVTNSLNQKHTYKYNRHVIVKPCLGKFGKNHPTSRSVNQLTLDGKFLCNFGSIREAERFLGIVKHSSLITMACKLKSKAYGYLWEYANPK